MDDSKFWAEVLTNAGPNGTLLVLLALFIRGWFVKLVAKVDGNADRLQDHDKRITAIEARSGTPGHVPLDRTPVVPEGRT